MGAQVRMYQRGRCASKCNIEKAKCSWSIVVLKWFVVLHKCEAENICKMKHGFPATGEVSSAEVCFKNQ